MKLLKFSPILLLAAALIPMIGQSRVKDTPHNLHGSNGIAVPNAEVCRPCHTPHNASTEVGYLWNHALSTAAWTLHDDADPASIMSSSSRLCLSCHDGTVALDSYGGGTGTNFIDGDDNLGTDLTTTHPIGVDYPTNANRYNQPDASGNIVDPVETPAGQSAHLEDGKVQCSSCHFAHGSRAAYGMFLRVDNTGSALCMTCHRSPG
jgi:predicted CXXCH cytochrome family protein